jgi:tetratricopeptide (TPR) repeat protein
MFALSYTQDRASDALAVQTFAENAVLRAGNPADLRARLAFQIGSALVELGRYEDASAQLARADRIWDDELDPGDLEHARVLNTIGNVASYRRQVADALAAHQRALAIREAVLGSSHPDLSTLLDNIGGELADLGAFDAAGAACARAASLANTPTMTAFARQCEGKVAHRRGDLSHAAALFQAAIADLGDSPGSGHRYYLLVELGEVSLERGDLSVAATACERARAELGDADSHPDGVRALECLRRAGRR